MLQIPTHVQTAAAMVCTYPALLHSPYLEKLAEKYGEPCRSDIMNQLPGCGHNLTWKHVEAYVEDITVDNLLTHIPFLQHPIDPSCVPRELYHAEPQLQITDSISSNSCNII